MARPATPPLVRLMACVEKRPEGCWIWLGTVSKIGYGRINVPQGDGTGKHVHTHRLAYELFVGPIPEGLQIDHLCFEKRCVNPAHLEPVTAKENTRRFVEAKKVYCKRGHLRTGLAKNGVRFCEVCHRDAVRRSRLRKTAGRDGTAGGPVTRLGGESFVG